MYIVVVYIVLYRENSIVSYTMHTLVMLLYVILRSYIIGIVNLESSNNSVLSVLCIIK